MTSATFTSVTFNLPPGLAATALDLSGDDAVVALGSQGGLDCPAAASGVFLVDVSNGSLLPISVPLPPPPSGTFPSWVLRFN